MFVDKKKNNNKKSRLFFNLPAGCVPGGLYGKKNFKNINTVNIYIQKRLLLLRDGHDIAG